MEYRKYCFVILFGLLVGTAGHAHDFSGCFASDSPQEEVGTDSQGLPFHYEQIHLLSRQQAFQQNHSNLQTVLLAQDGFDIWMSKRDRRTFTFLQDVRSLLETQLFPFHSFW